MSVKVWLNELWKTFDSPFDYNVNLYPEFE